MRPLAVIYVLPTVLLLFACNQLTAHFAGPGGSSEDDRLDVSELYFPILLPVWVALTIGSGDFRCDLSR